MRSLYSTGSAACSTCYCTIYCTDKTKRLNKDTINTGSPILTSSRDTRRRKTLHITNGEGSAALCDVIVSWVLSSDLLRRTC